MEKIPALEAIEKMIAVEKAKGYYGTEGGNLMIDGLEAALFEIMHDERLWGAWHQYHDYEAQRRIQLWRDIEHLQSVNMKALKIREALREQGCETCGTYNGEWPCEDACGDSDGCYEYELHEDFEKELEKLETAAELGRYLKMAFETDFFKNMVIDYTSGGKVVVVLERLEDLIEWGRELEGKVE